MTALVIAVRGRSTRLWDAPLRPRAYFALLLVFERALLLLFCARDLVLFYVGFEAMLIPLLFLMVAWGGGGARLATLASSSTRSVGTLLMLRRDHDPGPRRRGRSVDRPHSDERLERGLDLPRPS